MSLLNNKKSSGLLALINQFMKRGIPKSQLKWWILGVMIYLLLPFDLLPDPIPLLGWVDDFSLLYVFLKKLFS